MSTILSEKIIKCTGCDKSLKVPNSRLEVSRSVKCPNCGCSIFVNFVDEYASESPASSQPSPTNESETIYGGEQHSTGAYLEYEGMKYYIDQDVTVVGRRAGTSTADLQIDSQDMYMGRHHAVITRKTDFTGNTVYSLKCKDAKNGLTVNNIPVGQSGETVLLDGANIRMGHTVVVFRLLTES